MTCLGLITMAAPAMASSPDPFFSGLTAVAVRCNVEPGPLEATLEATVCREAAAHLRRGLGGLGVSVLTLTLVDARLHAPGVVTVLLHANPIAARALGGSTSSPERTSDGAGGSLVALGLALFRGDGQGPAGSLFPAAPEIVPLAGPADLERGPGLAGLRVALARMLDSAVVRVLVPTTRPDASGLRHLK